MGPIKAATSLRLMGTKELMNVSCFGQSNLYLDKSFSLHFLQNANMSSCSIRFGHPIEVLYSKQLLITVLLLVSHIGQTGFVYLHMITVSYCYNELFMCLSGVLIVMPNG